jgi:hypothetical protein
MAESFSLPEAIPSYQPFKYPPDFHLAHLHQRCSMPGKPDLTQPACPCCK